MYSLKTINLENRLHTLTESPRGGFNDVLMRFQHFVDKLKH